MALVKICGNTNRKDALMALELGADFVGVIVEVQVDTPRKVSANEAREILSDIPGGVMVLMPQSVEQALDCYDRVAPEYVQLHGTESVGFVKELRKAMPCKIIKTIHLSASPTGSKPEVSNLSASPTGSPPSVANVNKSAVEEALEYAPFCDYLLLDTLSVNMGGSGVKHDWSISREIVHAVEVPVILAGGLNPGNVVKAVNVVKPYAVDVSSGVESKPGKKDYEKVKNFIAAAKQA